MVQITRTRRQRLTACGQCTFLFRITTAPPSALGPCCSFNYGSGIVENHFLMEEGLPTQSCRTFLRTSNRSGRQPVLHHLLLGCSTPFAEVELKIRAYGPGPNNANVVLRRHTGMRKGMDRSARLDHPLPRLSRY